MDARKSKVASQGEIVNDSQIFFEVTGPPTHGHVLGMGAGVKPRDGEINQLKEEMPRMIANASKKMGFNSMQEPTTQTNAGEGNQNVDENTEDDFEEEDDSDGFQKENTNSDDD
nr:hypothetical protein CFP56_03511 [Quercus suber]